MIGLSSDPERSAGFHPGERGLCGHDLGAADEQDVEPGPDGKKGEDVGIQSEYRHGYGARAGCAEQDLNGSLVSDEQPRSEDQEQDVGDTVLRDHGVRVPVVLIGAQGDPYRRSVFPVGESHSHPSETFQRSGIPGARGGVPRDEKGIRESDGPQRIRGADDDALGGQYSGKDVVDRLRRGQIPDIGDRGVHGQAHPQVAEMTLRRDPGTQIEIDGQKKERDGDQNDVKDMRDVHDGHQRVDMHRQDMQSRHEDAQREKDKDQDPEDPRRAYQFSSQTGPVHSIRPSRTDCHPGRQNRGTPSMFSI